MPNPRVRYLTCGLIIRYSQILDYLFADPMSVTKKEN
jgi:hypothetical protein